MIIWLNGAFGMGKTTTATGLLARIPDALLVDPEEIGYTLRPTLAADYPVDDFQEWPPWRQLVVAQLTSIHEFTGRPLVVPQTVVVREYWNELSGGIRDAGVPLVPVTLTADAAEHERRITGDEVEAQAAEWRRTRAADFRAALSWLALETTVIDTSGMTPADVIDAVIEAAPGLAPPSPGDARP